MNTRIVFCMLVLALCCSAAQAYTLRFDDIPSGSGLDYYNGLYGVTFSSGFSVVDGADSKVLTWNLYGPVGFIFADGFYSGISGYYPLHYTARSVGACFSTDMGVVMHMSGYRNYEDHTAVASVIIGRPDESWNGRYKEITSEAGDIGYVVLEVLQGPPGSYSFSADDVTVDPVPEPSAFAALLVGLGSLMWRKKR
ncbi:MAG: PEP-CTERM sorting domain-containing protein [Armatimonadota bacterium]